MQPENVVIREGYFVNEVLENGKLRTFLGTRNTLSYSWSEGHKVNGKWHGLVKGSYLQDDGEVQHMLYYEHGQLLSKVIM